MKKILTIDDQQLVLLSLEMYLTDLGFEVHTCNNVHDAIQLYDQIEPDLVIVDMNMPVLPSSISNTSKEDIDNNAHGLKIVKYIKIGRKKNTPVIVLSGNTQENVILEGFDLGADDYLKKPLSLNEIGARVKKILGTPKVVENVDHNNQFLQEKTVGVVIPCYNEEKRLLSTDFKNFIKTNLGYHLCFVNDGSTDSTLKVLNELCEGSQNNMSVYNCEKNGGKAEAVRLGILHLTSLNQFDYIGFLDADLSTDFADFQKLVDTIKGSEYKIVSGSRIDRMGAEITKESARKIISMTINFIIRKTLGMDFRDTQCGAKVMNQEIIEKTFQKKFITKWLFDVEIFMRMRKIYGAENAKKVICEVPLKRWIHVDGSKLSFKDSFKIVFQLGKIAFYYKLFPNNYSEI
ncbi:transcriptional regulator [Flavobacterium covae]|uniref:dolichyl-phosphate beta-glucosyltransferase n=1 Tax=Flavobacterium columnare (strain ATCC 49512 / CIP 103533 / TG 44/87) TaxID=1041826 RepID=G8X8Q2_FLACA|nr:MULTISPECIES: glycosyltransferase [Flavobacterium]AEW86503.1 putative glycosyl transferase [Flavobacterium columnare ATCC 49512]AND63878.1 transcriptional regulator [Flavobacterium covae]